MNWNLNLLKWTVCMDLNDYVSSVVIFVQCHWINKVNWINPCSMIILFDKHCFVYKRIKNTKMQDMKLYKDYVNPRFVLFFSFSFVLLRNKTCRSYRNFAAAIWRQRLFFSLLTRPGNFLSQRFLSGRNGPILCHSMLSVEKSIMEHPFRWTFSKSVVFISNKDFHKLQHSNPKVVE